MEIDDKFSDRVDVSLTAVDIFYISTACSMMCWCYHKYTLAARLGETPFMSLIPCATFALRVKVRTLFGIKVSSTLFYYIHNKFFSKRLVGF